MDNASAFSQVLRFLEEGLADLVSNIPAFRRGEITELRLRTGRPLSAVFGAESLFLSVRGELTEHAAGAYICTGAELQDPFYKLCRNSVYAYEQELKEGFVTIPGGHRCGFAGRTVVQDGAVTGLREISSINIRIARQVVGCADGILPYIYDRSGLRSGLIVSPPGGGKTTVLKDLIRSLSCAGRKVAVVDERGELASMFGGVPQNDLGPLVDVLDGTPKKEGILQALRCLSPDVIVFDELGDEAEAEAVLQGMGAGVPVIFSLHARSAEEAARRPQAAKLLDAGAVDVIAVLEGARRPGTLREVLRVQRTHGERDGVKYESRRDTASVRSRRFGWVPESRGPAPQDV